MEPSEFEAKLTKIIESNCINDKDDVEFTIRDLEELIEEWNDGR